MNLRRFALATGASAIALSCGGAAAAATKTETRAVFLSTLLNDSEAEFGKPLPGIPDPDGLQFEKLSDQCAPSGIKIETLSIPKSLEELLGFIASAVVNFVFDRVSEAVAAELRKYTHTFEAKAGLAAGDGKPRPFSLYTGRTVLAGPEMAVRCFRITKANIEAVADAAGAATEKKTLVMDFVGLIERTKDRPHELTIRPVRLIYVKPEARSKSCAAEARPGRAGARASAPSKCPRVREGEPTRTNMGVSVSLAMKGTWREDNKIVTAPLFDAEILTEAFTLEEIAEKGYVERWYESGAKDSPAVYIPLPPSSKIGNDVFAPNSASATVSVIEAGNVPEMLAGAAKLLSREDDVKEVKQELTGRLTKLLNAVAGTDD